MKEPGANDAHLQEANIYWHGDMCVEPVQGTALLRLCEQLMLEPELTLQKAIFISSQIVTAMEEAKIIAQEAVDHVQAVHSLTE